MILGGDQRSVEALSPDGKMVVREVASLMFDTDEWPNGEGWLEDAANARLISAAPELLAACENALEHIVELTGGIRSKKSLRIQNDLREAINKATEEIKANQ